MNFHKITISYFIIILCLSLASSCKNDAPENTAEATPANTEAAEEPASMHLATLSAEQIQTVGIQYCQIEHKELTSTIKANGNLIVPNHNKANATSLYGGVVKNINVQVGSYVKKGQTIASIANPEFIQLQENYLTTAAKIVYAEQELQRQKELNDGNAGTKKNLQIAIADLKTLQTQRASLQQQIQLMGISPSQVSNTNLRSELAVTSPISGTVSLVHAKIGSYVDVSSPVAEIVDNGSLHLDLNIFEKDLPLLQVGQTIHFTLTNNPTQEYDAQIYSIGTAFENESKTIPVHCTVQGNKTGLIDGMNITALVSLSSKTAPAVPQDAIVESEGKTYIFIQARLDSAAQDHTTFRKIEIIRGVSNLGYTAISPVTDLPADAQIVCKGAFFINAKLTNTEEE